MSSAGARRPLLPLTLTTIGVVYNDIGTSPLYAMRECFYGSHSVPATPANVLGVLSLIIYSLLIVISIKYIAIVMRADNQGEGGILALTALLPQRSPNAPKWPLLVMLGLFGETLIATGAPGMARWREHLFVLIARNAGRATAFFRLPPERVVELGVQVEL